MNGTNIVKFPKKHMRPEILSEEMAAKHQKGKEYFVQEMTARYLEQALEGLVTMGVPIDSPEYHKCIAYLQNVIMAIFYRYADLDHELHAIFEQGIPVETEDGIIGYLWTKGTAPKTNTASPDIA
jgi:hypothetical protein